MYTGFSNYKETNLEQRVKAFNDEIEKWGDKSTKYVEYRTEWNNATKEGYLPKFPLHVDIELSDACNLKCQMCAHGLGTVNNVGFMDNELTLKMIDEVVALGTYSVKFNWRGEAVLNPFLVDAIKYAKEKGILEVAINTNGLPKKENLLIDCAKSGLDRIIFSVDGFSKDTYESIRIGGDYEKLKKNILDVCEWKKQNNTDKPFIRIQMVRTNTNAHEVEDFLSYWKDKVDDVRISDVMNRGQGNNLSVGDQKTVARKRCPQPFQRLIIARDGRVSPCCADWDQKYVVGSIFDSSLKDIWVNDKMKFIRNIQENLEHDKIDICKNCYVKESYVWESN